MKYPIEILNNKNEYVKFFVKRFPVNIFKIIMKPHLQKERYEYIVKEITEVVSVYNTLKLIIKKERFNSFVLFELASGDGLFSHFVAYNFPNSKIFAIDLNFSSDYEESGKSKFLSNLFFIKEDIKNLYKNANGINLDCVDFIVSIHACNELSEIAIEIASKMSKYFILVPCCIGSKKYEEWKKKNEIANKFFNAIENEYYKWCFYLAEHAKLKGFMINLKKDNKMLSERNIIIVGKNMIY